MSNPLFFSKKQNDDNSSNQESADITLPSFKVLIVDDETEIHRVTELTLKRFRYKNHKINFIHAYSAKEAISKFEENDDIALALVDVVMETDHAGLDLIDHVRNILKNNSCRIVLRTGQPGQAPEHEIIEKYDINDYKEKTELTSQKLKTLMYSGLRSYSDLMTIENHKNGLKRVIESSSNILKPSSINDFATAILKEVLNILKLPSTSIYCLSKPANTNTLDNEIVLAATGNLETIDQSSYLTIPNKIKDFFTEALVSKKSMNTDSGYIYYARSDRGFENLLYIETNKSLDQGQKELLDLYCNHVSLSYENLMMSYEVTSTQRDLVYLLGDAIEVRSKETGAHVKRIALYTYQLALMYGLTESEAKIIKYASPLHDLGKVSIPDSVLHKPGKLSPEEWEIMKTHAQVGFDILNKSKKSILKKAAEICITHHEYWNGEGYPNRLKGDEIPIAGRITALSDVFDALGSARCYKPAWSREDIMNEIEKQSGKQFDPLLVKILLENSDVFWNIRDQYPD